MAQITVLEVTGDHAVPVDVQEGSATISVDSTGGTVYYGYSLPVNAANNAGSIAPGGQVTVTQDCWIVASALAGVTVTVTSVYDDWAIPPLSLATSVSPRMYGARGDGVTNDDAAFAAWIAALNVPSRGYGFVPAGHYILVQAWPAITQSDVVIDLSPSAILDWTGAPANSVFIRATGAEGSTVSLTANAPEASTALSVAAGGEAGFAGNYLRLCSNAIWDPGRTNTPIGEQALCTTTASGVINLWTPTAIGPYNTTDSATVSVMTHVTGFRLRGGTILGGGSGQNQQAVYLDKCRDAIISDLVVRNVEAVGIVAVDSIDVLVTGCEVYDCNSTSTGYCVSWSSASMDCVAVDSYFNGCRHAVTMTATTGRKGIVLRCGARGCTLWGNVNTGDGFDTHAGAADVFYEFCKVYGATGQGVNIECASARVIGCETWDTAEAGIGMHNETVQPTDYECRDNKVYKTILAGTNSVGIRYSQAATAGAGQTVRKVIVDSNEVYGSADSGILVATDGTYRVANVTVRGNMVNSPAVHGIIAEYIDDALVADNHVSGIAAGNYGIELRSITATPVAANKVKAASATTTTGIYALTGCANLAMTGNVVSSAANGIQVSNDSTNCTITGNDPSTCTTPISPGTGTGHLVANNQWGANPPAKNVLTVGASPFTWQNATGYRVALTVYAGTVTAVKYSRDNSSFYNTGTTQGQFVVDPGDYLQVTYTAAPSIEQWPLR